MINLTADDIVAIGKANLARNVYDLATNELFGLPECNGKSWSKEFLRFLVLEAYDSCPSKSAYADPIFPDTTGVCVGDTLPFSRYQVVVQTPVGVSPTVTYVSFFEGTIPPVVGVFTLQHVVDMINDPTYGKGFTAVLTGPNTMRVFAPPGSLYNACQLLILWYSSLPYPVCNDAEIFLFNDNGQDAVSNPDQQTIDCYYSVLNT